MQIILITTFGVIMGSLVTFLLAAFLPAAVPIVFNGPSILIAIASLLIIGPLGWIGKRQACRQSRTTDSIRINLMKCEPGNCFTSEFCSQSL